MMENNNASWYPKFGYKVNFTIMSIKYLIYCAFRKGLDSKPIEIEGLEKPYILSGYDTQS